MRQGFASYKDGTLEDLLSSMRAELSVLPKQEAKVAQYILLNLNGLSFETGRTIARKANVSEVTVGRTLRRFGCDSVKGLKALLQKQYTVAGGVPVPRGELTDFWQDRLNAEQAALQAVYEQRDGAMFEDACRALAGSREVFVTGFQTVRGLAEDAARRLSLARPRVRYLSPNDGMAAEWIGDLEVSPSCLLLVDVVPYASESQTLARMAREQGRRVVVVSDGFCHWAAEGADAAIYAPSSTGLFLESTLVATEAPPGAAACPDHHGIVPIREDGAVRQCRTFRLSYHRIPAGCYPRLVQNMVYSLRGGMPFAASPCTATHAFAKA